jgi:methylene-tetrahydromethanopterin dehydrogenase
MKDPYLLHMFNPTKNVSPFDVNMAYEAQFDGVIPYSEVALDDIHALTQDTIFSRGKKGVKRTGIFIGGREFGLAIDMLNRAKTAMVPPFEVSVFADPSGAITTAAALMACIEIELKKKGEEGFDGKRIDIIGGTGPVGVCAGILAANCGADVYLTSRRGSKVATEYASEYNARFGVEMHGEDSSTDDKIMEFLTESHVVIGAAKAGIQVLSAKQLEQASNLLVAADVNAVPPLGIEGVGVHDMGVELPNTPQKASGLGALAVGDIKYKVHFTMFEMMKNTDAPLYLDHVEAFKVAREFAAKL